MLPEVNGKIAETKMKIFNISIGTRTKGYHVAEAVTFCDMAKERMYKGV